MNFTNPPPGMVAIPLEVARENPIITRYLNLMHTARESGREFRNTKPWHAIAEQWLTSIAFANDIVEVPGIGKDDMAHIGAVIAHATPYLWSEAVERIAMAAPMPRHVISATALPEPSMFWSREVANVDKTGQDWWLVSLTTQGKTIMCLTNTVDNDAHTVSSAGFGIDLGSTWPDDYEGKPEFVYVEQILQRLSFLNSRYVSAEPQSIGDTLPREIRREFHNKKTPLPTTRLAVVNLRREEPKHVGPPAESTGVTWHHQWWVTGHHRPQWYASEQAHHVIWIAPYLKGPKDRPIKERVYRVTR